jgi:hypothetical protein
VYTAPGSDEFKKKENKISDSPSKEDAAHSCAWHTNFSMVIGADGNVTHTPLRPPSPPPAHIYDTVPQRPHVVTPTLPTKHVACLQADCHVVDCRRRFICPPIETPAPLPINLNIPPKTNLTTPRMTDNVQMNQSLVAGATFNLNIKDELRKAREEVECLKRQNQHLLENNERLNEVNRDLPKTSGLVYDFCVGKHEAEIIVILSQMKVNASNLDTVLKNAESEKNNIRQKLDSMLRDLNAEWRNHNTLKKTTQSRWTSQPAVKDLAHELNTYGKRNWSQFISELWQIDQAREKIMYKATETYQDEYCTHVNIASTIDMGRGLNLSGYENMVKIERGKRKWVKCLLPSASSIQKAMKCAEEIMTEIVPWELVAGSNGKINGGFLFDIEKLFIHLIKSYRLE